MSPHLPALKPKEVIRALQRAGFFIHHTSASHYILKHPEHPTLRVTIAYHSRDLKRKTLTSIIEQAGFTNEEFMRLL
jgi:predicted RNA binding protein YcfA (HicA-like mRNA interferase family)